ncbi:MAG: M1 family metallopeptidase [Flavobacteriales bacterium]|nr:M1 family metallopeptidase [Flavobacteriales bacterium]MCB9447185.1 M1 family metallopeptidase [Flavobacteriales bacterium]
MSLFALITAGRSVAQEKTYFQQSVDYTIHVSLDDVNHMLSANETVVYTNHSPDTLRELYFHIWPNAYKNNETALGKQLVDQGNRSLFDADESSKGWIDSLHFQANGKDIKWSYDPQHIDIALLTLNEPLLPEANVTITTPFKVKVPSGKISRLGHMGQQYQITQWYPKPAVYDRDGWHAMPYLHQGEFYSEFGSYDVSIELPANYVVGATGDLQKNPEEERRLIENAMETAKITDFDTTMAFPASDTKRKTLRFVQHNVHDFAWFADKRYHVLHGEVKLPHSGRKVQTWVMFTNDKAKLWKDAIQYVNDAVYYYSLWNGDYPYNHATAVDGTISAGGGMEYPNITVIGRTNSATRLDEVIAHEVGHNWFYGILGSNERIHPWMDEGINSFNELRYMTTKYPGRKLLEGDVATRIAERFDLAYLPARAEKDLSYLINARSRSDQPCEGKAIYYTELNYGGMVYAKTAIAFDYLLAWLGPDVVDSCMHAYFNAWKFKHPQPEDFRRIWEEKSGKDLAWFFDDVIDGTAWLDYKLADVSKDGSHIRVRNAGEVPGPFYVNAYAGDSIVATKWYDGFKGSKQLEFPAGAYDRLVINATGRMPETRRTNNTLRTHGILRGIEPLRIQWLGSTENPNRTQVFYNYLLGWNRYNGFMLGLALNNSLIPQKKFEWLLAPMYGFASNSLAGGARMTYHTYPLRSMLESVDYGLRASSFALSNSPLTLNYYRIMPEVRLKIRRQHPTDHLKQQIRLRAVYAIENQSKWQQPDPYVQGYYAYAEDNRYYVNEIAYKLENDRMIDPYGMEASYQYGSSETMGDFGKAQVELKYKLSFHQKRKGIELRAFGGAMLFASIPDSTRFGFGMSGNTDYMYDQLYFARNTSTGFFGQQVAVNDGGFKNLTGLPTLSWINSFNAMISLPGKLPLWLYGDIGTGGDMKKWAYDAGLAIRIVPDILEVYLPFAQSEDLNQLSFGQRIRFTFNITRMDPFEMLRNTL